MDYPTSATYLVKFLKQKGKKCWSHQGGRRMKIDEISRNKTKQSQKSWPESHIRELSLLEYLQKATRKHTQSFKTLRKILSSIYHVRCFTCIILIYSSRRRHEVCFYCHFTDERVSLKVKESKGKLVNTRSQHQPITATKNHSKFFFFIHDCTYSCACGSKEP